MTGFFREKARGQIDVILINGQKFGEEQIKELLKGVKANPILKKEKQK